MSAGDNTLHRGRGRGEVTPRTGLGRPRRWVQERETSFPGWTSAADLWCRYIHAWAKHGQVELESCRVAGWGGGVEGSGRDVINSTHSVLVVYVMLRYCGPLPPSAASSSSSWAPVLGLPARLAGWNAGRSSVSREECWKGGGRAGGGLGGPLALRRS